MHVKNTMLMRVKNIMLMHVRAREHISYYYNSHMMMANKKLFVNRIQWESMLIDDNQSVVNDNQW